METQRQTTILDEYERLEKILETHKQDNPQVGRELAVALTNLQQSRLWFQEAHHKRKKEVL